MKRLLIIALGLAMAIGAQSCKKDNNIVNSSCNDNTGSTAQFRGDEDPVAMRGHVKTTSGLAIAGAGVSITPAGQSSPVQTTFTDTDGAYILTNVEQGTYQLQLSASGYITKTVNLNVQSDIVRTDTLIRE